MPCLAHSRDLITACRYYNFELSFSKSPPGIPAVIALSQKFSIMCTLGINKLCLISSTAAATTTSWAQKIHQFAPYPFKSLEGVSLHTSNLLTKASSPGRLGPAPDFSFSS